LATKTQAVQPASGGDAEDQAELVRQFCRGDRSALAALVRLWEHRLLTIALRVVGNLHDAEEVRQLVLLRLVNSAGRQIDPDRFSGWIRRCTVNEAITWLRRHGTEANRRKAFDETAAGPAVLPADRVLAAEQTRLLQAALTELSPELRALVTLRFDEGLTIRQIAETVEKPPMTVHSQIVRAVDQLRQRLGPILA
jgi:RNA polymerase sigma-70 factor, ECF subfamily